MTGREDAMGRNEKWAPALAGAHFLEVSRRRPALPGGRPPSTIGAGGLNCRVRNGNGCCPAAMVTGNLAPHRRPWDDPGGGAAVRPPRERSIASTSRISLQALGRLVPVG